MQTADELASIVGHGQRHGVPADDANERESKSNRQGSIVAMGQHQVPGYRIFGRGNLGIAVIELGEHPDPSTVEQGSTGFDANGSVGNQRIEKLGHLLVLVRRVPRANNAELLACVLSQNGSVMSVVLAARCAADANLPAVGKVHRNLGHPPIEACKPEGFLAVFWGLVQGYTKAMPGALTY